MDHQRKGGEKCQHGKALYFMFLYGGILARLFWDRRLIFHGLFLQNLIGNGIWGNLFRSFPIRGTFNPYDQMIWKTGDREEAFVLKSLFHADFVGTACGDDADFAVFHLNDVISTVFAGYGEGIGFPFL